MIRAINAGDKNELRKLLKMYSQAIYQRAFTITGTPERAKDVTKQVLTYVTACASAGTCREDVDTWLMSVTDAHAGRYMENVRAEEAARASYFTAPTVMGNAPQTDAYSSNKPIYEEAKKEEPNEGLFIPFSPSLAIPERPEFADRQSEYSAQSRTSSITPPAAPDINTPVAPFTPPQYVPPQYTPPQESPVMEEIRATEATRKPYNVLEQGIPQRADSINGTPITSAAVSPDNIVPISLNDEEAQIEVEGKKKKKKRSILNNGVIIAVLIIVLLLVIGVLVGEIAQILLNA